jgi:hypothetical protein
MIKSTEAVFPMLEPANQHDPWPPMPDPYPIGNESEGGLTKTNVPMPEPELGI